MEHYDDIIIGSGQAAPALAVALATRGQKVALIEGNMLGGTCVNNGCTPTKTLRKSARVAHIARRASDFGVRTGTVEVDFPAAMARMNERVDTARRGLSAWLSRTKGVELIRGWGRLEGYADSNRIAVSVGGATITGGRVFLNTGTRPFVPRVPGLEGVPYLDNASLLAMKERPDHLVVVGGSYIGLEMGQIFRRLGSEVTVIHRADRLAEREDEDVSGIIADIMREDGVSLHLDAQIDDVARDGDGVLVNLAGGAAIAGSHLLFATGRTPNTDKLNLDSVGVETNERGYVVTDAKFRTNAPGVWALGDVNGRGAFTHTSYHDHEIVLAELDGLGDLHQWKDAEQRPATYAMFTDPPLGRVGISLNDARKAVAEGGKILFAEMLMSNISRAKEEGETTGLIRLLVDGDTEQILGATVFGINGDEIVAVISNFMATGASYKVMQQALPVHPTVAELLPTVLANLNPVER